MPNDDNEKDRLDLVSILCAIHRLVSLILNLRETDLIIYRYTTCELQPTRIAPLNPDIDAYLNRFRILLGGEGHVTPLQNPKTILDLGTGTGIWAVDIAE